MKKWINICILPVLLTLILSACGAAQTTAAADTQVLVNDMSDSASNPYTAATPISEVVNDPVFGDYGRLIFPVNDSYYRGNTLGELGLTWYNNIDPAKTVEIVNYMKTHAEAGDTIFYDIYTDEEKAADPAKEDTGLFFFKGNPGERLAICNAGGGFAYVGAMHDSFPHALELSKMGYNAFALIYRPGAQTACEDLARAITFLFDHAEELEVETDRYSLWGGSAGGRMAAYLGSYGPEAFGGGALPRPGAETYRGFTVDNVLHAGKNGDIHYNVYIPESYDGSRPYALFFTLPGYEGLYFQGVAANLRSENFGFEARKYHEDMIVVAPQLSDWRETSANQTIALAEYFLKRYNIDPSRVYANGYSGGGETMSIVMGKRPELFTAYLHCSSQWDGDLNGLAESRTPVYLVVGREDEYYGAEPSQKAYDTLHKLYREQGLTETEINRLLVLDIKERSYFTEKGVKNEHGGGNLFAADKDIMGWLFRKTKRTTLSGTIPEELEYIPEGYTRPAEHPGTLERLDYQTWESLSYEDHAQRLTKTAWVYLPYGYTPERKYNVMYLSHGGWSTDPSGLAAARDHRGFGGFSMGSMNTWHTFEHCLDYFRYFAPSSGGPIGNGAYMADIVNRSDYAPEDFFIFTASGTEDFAYSGFKSGVMAMAETDVFTLGSSEREGNLSFREREGYAHDGRAANEYMYNALRFFWN